MSSSHKDFHAMFADRDFEKMTVNVMKDPYPSTLNFFANKESFQKDFGVDKEVLVRYIGLFYDSKSPLFDKIPDHIERKKAAAVIAGFRAKDFVFPQQVQDILYCTNKDTNACIIEYLRSLRSATWSFIASAWEAYHKVLEDMMGDASTMSEKGSTKTSVDIAFARTKLSTQARIMLNDLNDLTLQFLSQDSSPYLNEHLFDLVEKERILLPITAERVAGIEV